MSAYFAAEEEGGVGQGVGLPRKPPTGDTSACTTALESVSSPNSLGDACNKIAEDDGQASAAFNLACRATHARLGY